MGRNQKDVQRDNVQRTKGKTRVGSRKSKVGSKERAAWVFHSAESAIFVSDNVALFRKAMIRYLYGISG